MMKSSITKSFVFLPVAAVVFVLVCGAASVVNAQQRDPFKKAGWATKKDAPAPKSGSGASAAKVAAPPVNYAPPPIEERIEYFKRLRESAAATGAPLPKVTSVLMLSEMAVSGIFKTPRGYAAMVEATPIKLSYTIYPGEKFFDAQLVAVEENRLIFRKVTKTGDGKFVASVENKPLRQFTMKAQVQGTAPTEEKPATTEPAKTEAAKAEAAPNSGTADKANTTNSNNSSQTQPAATPANTASNSKTGAKSTKPAGNPFLSPLDEMNSMPADKAKAGDKAKTQEKDKKPAAKPVKVAKNDGK